MLRHTGEIFGTKTAQRAFAGKGQPLGVIYTVMA
jgi:hypothetical protein